jgi:hypothetical protein
MRAGDFNIKPVDSMYKLLTEGIDAGLNTIIL